MYIYGVEEVKSKKSKKFIITIVMIAVIAIAMSAFGGIKLAQKVSKQKQTVRRK